MLIALTAPVGIDATIATLQKGIHAHLMSRWAISDTEQYQCYARCYKNPKAGGVIAEVKTTGDGYQEVFWNDNLTAISFFTTGDQVINDKGQLKTTAAFIIFCNLATIKPLITHRADEEVRRDVLDYFQGFGEDLISYETGVANVLKEFPGSRRAEGLKTVDMQPTHCFRVNLNIKIYC